MCCLDDVELTSCAARLLLMSEEKQRISNHAARPSHLAASSDEPSHVCARLSHSSVMSCDGRSLSPTPCV
jgi:hypothetical protein